MKSPSQVSPHLSLISDQESARNFFEKGLNHPLNADSPLTEGPWSLDLYQPTIVRSQEAYYHLKQTLQLEFHPHEDGMLRAELPDGTIIFVPQSIVIADEIQQETRSVIDGA